MSRCTACERAAGFSLVEVLCALAITALGLVALLRGLGGSQVAANYLEAHLGARIIAQSILGDERQAAETPVGTRQGKSGIYHWRLTVEPAQVSAVNKMPVTYRLYHLSVEVTWAPRGSFAIDTLKLGR
jgi:prepilin-type N-terminal cleavage/methylation domain-containing protein